MTKKRITMKELEEIYSIKRDKAMDLIDRKQITASKDGKCYLFDVESIESWLDGTTVKPRYELTV